MKFHNYINQYRNNIYEKICEYIPITDPKTPYGIIRDYVDRKGSYRRPGLLMLIGQLYGAPVQELLLPAAAEQLSEDWILMQDDVEDDSELRRKKPAAQRLYGSIHAFNATNIGHMAMWKMLKDYLIQYPKQGSIIYDKFYDMLNYTVAGQHIENEFIHYTKSLKNITEELYFRIVDSKTCYYTVFGPMQIGALVAMQGKESLSILKEIGTDAGIAFQIVDDVLDMIGDEEKTGKRINGDLYEGKLTLIILHAYGNASISEKLRIDSIFGKERKMKSKEDVSFLRDIIDKYDGIEYAENIAKQFKDKAEEMIRKYREKLPQNEYTPIVLSAIREMYQRDR